MICVFVDVYVDYTEFGSNSIHHLIFELHDFGEKTFNLHCLIARFTDELNLFCFYFSSIDPIGSPTYSLLFNITN